MTYEDAKRLAYRRLAMRSYHSTEMAEYLTEKGAATAVVAQVVSELTKLGYLNDAEWIAGMVRSLSARKYGPRAIAYKLSVKGIPESEYLPHVEELEGSQAQQIRALLQSKYKSRDLTDFKQRQKVIAALVRKGYSLPDVIQSVTSQK